MTPNVEIITEPTNEQLMGACTRYNIILKAVPEKTDRLVRILPFLNSWTFILTKIPNKIEVTLVNRNPVIASSAR